MNDFESERQDIEWAFIRILSVRGVILSGEGLSLEDRRERIRLAILDQHARDRQFNESYTFAQAYKRCYNRLLDSPRGAAEAQDHAGV